MKLKDIKPNKANPRTIKDDKFRKLLKSIQEFPKMMELRPMVIDADGTMLLDFPDPSQRYAICEQQVARNEKRAKDVEKVTKQR